MHITWHSHYTIKIQTGETTLILDPHASFRGKADVVALSNPSHPNMANQKGIQGEPQIISTPGEYSLRDMTLHGLGWQDDKGVEHSLQRWDIEKMVLLHLGDLNRELSTSELQELERTDIDILFLPVDNANLPLPIAMGILTTIEPRLVIPINYTNIKPFADEMGIDPKQTEPKFIAKASKLPADEMQTVILKP